MKTQLGILLLIALLAGAATGCGRKAPGAAGPQSTTVAVDQGDPGVQGDVQSDPRSPDGAATPGLAIPLVRGATDPYGSRPDPRTIKPGDPDPEWKSQPLDAIAIAKRADAALAELRGVHGQAQMTMTLPEGTAKALGEMKIRSRDTFQLTFIDFENGFPKNARAVADGQRRTILGERIVHTPVDAPNPALATTQLMEEWAKELPRRVIGGFLERRPAFSEYVTALSEPGSGYKVRTDVRKMVTTEGEMSFYRIVATRTPDAGTKSGAHTIELVFDNQKGLPVLVHTRLEPKGELPTEIRWQAGWRGEQRFDDADFLVPKATS